MIAIQDWARDLLVSRGALVESEEDGAIRALLPADVAAVLGAGEWLSLDFRPRPGADDPIEWMERLERLLPAGLPVTGTQVRNPGPAGRMDAATALSSELAIQNGIYRFGEDFDAAATYLFFTLEYAIDSDDRNLGLVTVCLNTDARSIVASPESFLRGIRDGLEEAETAATPDVILRSYPMAAKAAREGILKHAARIEESANRRLARDAERVESYYSGLLAQIEKRIARRADDAAAAEKERGRARATETDRIAKLEDLLRKYSLRIQIEPRAVLAVRAPVRQMSIRLVRKKQERPFVLHWNPVLRALESPLCESCSKRAHPLFLCEQVHCLCNECWTACPGCSKFFCRACQRQCKCGR